MRQVISSGWTLFFKLLVPPMLVTLSVFLLVDLFNFRRLDALIGTLIVIGATVFFCWWGAKLKQVSIDQNNFYVAGLLKEISISFTDIYSINELQGGWPVIVRLKEKSQFGRTILFLAEWRPLLLGSAPPSLLQLRRLISENRDK